MSLRESTTEITYEEVRTTDLTVEVFFALSRSERVPASAGLRMSVSASVYEHKRSG
jgi:hypothetical protein